MPFLAMSQSYSKRLKMPISGAMFVCQPATTAYTSASMKITSRQVKAVVSIAFFLMLFAIVRKGEFVAMLKQVDPFYFVLSFVIAAAQISTSCLKWKVLVNLYDRSIGFGFLMKNYLIGYYFSNLLPSNVGGDVVRSYHVGRRIGSQTHAAISVFIERFTGMICMLLLVIFMPLLWPGAYRHPAVYVPALGAAGLLILFAWMALIDKPLSKLAAMFLRILQFLRSWRWLNQQRAAGRILHGLEIAAWKILRKTERIHEKLAATIDCLKKDKKAFLAVILLTVLFYALTWINVFWAFKTFRITPDFANIASLLPTAMLVSAIPITLGSLGIAEGSYVFYFGLVGMSTAATLAMGLFLRFKLIVVGIVGFANFLTYRHEKYDYSKLREQE